MSLSSPAGEVIVVHVTGEVDLFTIAVLQDALAGGLARGPRDLIVDLSAMTFCALGGLRLLVDTGISAAGRGIGYAVAGVPAQANLVWSLLWAVAGLPVQFPSAAKAVADAMARHVSDDRAGRGAAGDQPVVPAARHTLDALKDSAVLLTVGRHG
jgi:anti-sigma B factor antagonist